MWTAECALEFVQQDQGEPDGYRWQLKGEGPRYATTPSPHGDIRCTAPETIKAWGVVSPPLASDTDDSRSKPRFWASTTPWNGRGAGQPPDFEYAVELVAEEASDG